jgi:hypothetical protein
VHWHRRQLALVSVAFCLISGGAAARLALSGSASGSPRSSPPHLQVDSVYCNESGGPGQTRHGSCIFTLTDGRRFECPLRFGTGHPTPASLMRAKACHALSPLRIPAAWKRVFERLYAVQACLTRHGIRVNGGPALGSGDPKRTPLGELDVASKPMAIIAFYTSARVARRAEPKILSRIQHTGGSVQRHGAVSVVWTSPPSSQLDSTVTNCVSA